MKKTLLALAFGLLAVGAFAQGSQDEAAERLWRQQHHQRDHSRHHLTSGIPQAPAAKGPAKHTSGMPDGPFWFPGEWEEVQAIVVTPYYSYRSTNGNYYADPMVTGIAGIYTNAYSQYPSSYGPYISILDTTSDFGTISFRLMDAIQLGGAQAWVRVEQEADTAIVVRQLQRMGLRHDNLRFLVAPGNSFWYRDCGPICFYFGDEDQVGMLDFEYYPGRALDDSLPVYIERQFGLPNFTTMIEWEGGNCLVDGAGMVFSSDAIYSNNNDTYGQLTWDGSNTNTINYTTKPSLSQDQVKDSLHALIGPRATYILPAFRYDGGTGHVDLYADMLDENKFVFSVMPDDYSGWTDYRTGVRNMDSLCGYQSFFGRNYRSVSIPFPSRDNGSNFSSQTQYNQQYTRTYSNHTFVNNVIIQPCFSPVGDDGMPTAAWDRANIEAVQAAYPGYTIYCVDVREFDGSGGAIHCVTKQIPAESPIRILHPDLYGCRGVNPQAEGIPFNAYITNNKGIAQATLHYRIDGGEWQSVAFEAQADNLWRALMPTSIVGEGDSVAVEYYISATNTVGKTITKPMTAATGGYFGFGAKYDPTAPLAIAAADEAEQHFGQFWPNPASDVANISVSALQGEVAVTIVDPLGRPVYRRNWAMADGTFSINTSRLAAGHYTVLFQHGGERVVRKLIVR